MTLSRSLTNLGGNLRSLLQERLWLQVLIGMALGIATGICIGPSANLVPAKIAVVVANWVALPGQLFLLSIQFVVIPLVVAAVSRGICAGQGSADLGRLGSWTVTFFLRTALIAVSLGIAVALLIEPGRYIDGASMQLLFAADAPVVDKAQALPGDQLGSEASRKPCKPEWGESTTQFTAQAVKLLIEFSIPHITDLLSPSGDFAFIHPSLRKLRAIF